VLLLKTTAIDALFIVWNSVGIWNRKKLGEVKVVVNRERRFYINRGKTERKTERKTRSEGDKKAKRKKKRERVHREIDKTRLQHTTNTRVRTSYTQ